MAISTRHLIQVIASAHAPNDALTRLLEICVNELEGVSGCLYRLDLAASAYRPVHCTAGHAAEAAVIQVADLPGLREKNSLLEAAIRTLETRTDVSGRRRAHAQQSGSRLVVPISRSSFCLGLIDISGGARSITQDAIELVETAADLALILFDARDVFQMLQISQQPVDFDLAFDAFIEAIIKLIADASGMRYIALREHDTGENMLRCIGSTGFETVDDSTLDLAPVDDYPTFKKALEERQTQVERDMSEEHLANLRAHELLKSVKSFVVCPVKVGTGIYGTLSLATDMSYQFEPLKIAAFESIANGIGVAIVNYQNVHRDRERDFQFAKSAAALTAVEVAQAARHVARGLLDKAQLQLGNLNLSVRKHNPAEAVRTATELGDVLKEVEQTLNRIRDVTKPPRRELATASLRETWDDVFSMLGGRLASLNVKYSIVGQDVRVEMYPDLLRHAWLNLVLNSIDAFKDKRQKGSRAMISVAIDPGTEATQDVKIRFIDTATGIDPSRIPTRPGDAAKALKDLIFEPGVTSKEDGSGYGLTLVRKILRDHKGSIDLVDHRGGVVFEIRMRKHLGR
jgi:signal transduction histidine kinase